MVQDYSTFLPPATAFLTAAFRLVAGPLIESRPPPIDCSWCLKPGPASTVQRACLRNGCRSAPAQRSAIVCRRRSPLVQRPRWGCISSPRDVENVRQAHPNLRVPSSPTGGRLSAPAGRQPRHVARTQSPIAGRTSSWALRVA